MAAINRSTDMTTGSIWKRMVSFAVPVFLGNLCQQLYNTVDSVIVGKFVGKQALAAVGGGLRQLADMGHQRVLAAGNGLHASRLLLGIRTFYI